MLWDTEEADTSSAWQVEEDFLRPEGRWVRDGDMEMGCLEDEAGQGEGRDQGPGCCVGEPAGLMTELRWSGVKEILWLSGAGVYFPLLFFF